MNNTINRRNEINNLIFPEDVKVYVNVGVNINDLNIIPVIKLAQDLYVKTVLGLTLYNKLMVEWDLANRVPDDLRDGTQTPDGVDYKELYNQLYYALIWWTAVHLILVTGIKIEEKGVMLNNSDYAENGNLDLIRVVEDRFRTFATNYQEQFVCYVKDTFKEDTVVKSESTRNGTGSIGVYLPVNLKNCKQC